MAANDIIVACLDPAAETNLARAVKFTRTMRTGLRFSHGAPGGNLTASWTVSCDHLADVGYPQKKSRIAIYDPVRHTYLWRGVLKTPREHLVRGRLSSITFSAVGCAEGSWRQFPEPTVFGVTDVLSTLNGRQLATDLGEIMKFGLRITPLVNGSQGGIQSGGILTEDTGDYRGHTAPQLWEDVCNLTRSLGTPFIWMVEPDATGSAALSFFAEVPNPRYWEHGNAKTNDLEVDWSTIANIIYVAFQGKVIQLPPPGDPLDYTATPDEQSAFINVSETIREYNTAQGFAASLYQKWNQSVVTGGQIVLDRDIRTNINGVLEIIPVYEVRAGRGIQIEKTKTPYHPGVAMDIIIKTAEYDEDACTMTLSPAVLTEEGKQVRILAIRAEQSQSKMTWSWTDRNMATNILPPPDAISTSMQHQVENWTRGAVADTPGTSPSVSRDVGNGTAYNADGTPKSFDPNSVPPAWNRTLLSNAQAYLLERGAPIIARVRDGLQSLGSLGWMIHPQLLPPERINIPAVFSTADDEGSLDDGERMHTDVQEGYIDTFTCSVLNQISTSVVIKVDVWNWDDDDIRLPNAFVMTLDSEDHQRIQYDNTDDDKRPVLLYHGDQLRWKVEGAEDPVILNCALSGDKNWGQFPVLVGPNWVPGNS